MHFQCQNRRFRVSKHQTKALSLIFHQLRNKKIVKAIGACTQKSPIYYYKPSKKHSSRDTIPLTFFYMQKYFSFRMSKEHVGSASLTPPSSTLAKPHCFCV
jgi:hypothetical protein